MSLGEAGIAVWILTGDKKETAINISYACGHLQPGLTVLDLTGLTNITATPKVLFKYHKISPDEQILENESLYFQLQGYADKMPEIGSNWGLVVDGASLAVVMPDPQNRLLLYTVAARCRAVVCCRMSPLQKSEIVKMMKESPGRPVTAAIGDGGNDVAMIQEAHVGLGIMGREGRAAVRAADFAFAKFQMTRKVF